MRTLIAIWLPTTFSTMCIVLAILFSPLFLIPALFGIADARSRYMDFKYLSQYKHAHPAIVSKTIQRFKHSACQRYAAIAAIGPLAMSQFRRHGYRWWHLLPDGTFSRKSPYLKLSFYRQLFTGTRC